MSTTHKDAGYSIYEQVFGRRDMVRVLEVLAGAGLERTQAGARHVLNVPVVGAGG